MSYYDPLDRANPDTLARLLELIYVDPDQPVQLDELRSHFAEMADSTFASYITKLAQMGAVRKAFDNRKRIDRVWPTVLGRLWWHGMTDRGPGLDFAPSLFELDEPDQPLDDVEPY